MERIPDEVLGKPEDWRPLLAQLVASDAIAKWTSSATELQADNPDQAKWSHAQVPQASVGDCVLRLRATIGARCWGIKLRHGAGCEAMLLGNGAFIYTPAGGIAYTDKLHLEANSELELVLRVQQGQAEVWVNGLLALRAELELGPAPIGIGLVGGQASLHDFALREL